MIGYIWKCAKLYKLVEVGDGSAGSTALIIAEIVAMHVASTVLTPTNEIDNLKLQPLFRMGSDTYGVQGDKVAIETPRTPIYSAK